MKFFLILLLFLTLFSACKKNLNRSLECEGINCGKKGYCNVKNKKPFCRCDKGFHEENLKCVPENLKGYNVFDLINDKKIFIEARGSGIQKVKLFIENKSSESFNIIIPAGTYFSSKDRFVKSMISIKKVKIRIGKDKKKNIYIDAVSINFKKRIPNISNVFSVVKNSKMDFLNKVIENTKNLKVKHNVIQATIWIVTDNVTYDDFKRFVIGLKSILKADDIVKAMQICENSGVDITKKAIIRAKEILLESLTNKALKNWLKNKTPEKEAWEDKRKSDIINKLNADKNKKHQQLVILNEI